MNRPGRGTIDSLAVILLTALSAFAVHTEVPGARVAGTALLVLFLPGYALSVALFPRAPSAGASSPFERTAMERLGLTTALSLALLALVALVSNFTPYGITRAPILVGISGLTVAFAFAGAVRRLRLTPPERFTPSLRLSAVLFTSRSDRQSDSSTAVYNLALGLSLLLILGSAGFAVVRGADSAEFTELSIEMNGQTVEEAAVLEPGEPMTVVVENHEGERHEYTAVVVAQRVAERPDGTVRIDSQRRLATRRISVAASERATIAFDVSPPRGEAVRVAVLLYKGDPPANPSRESAYRVLRVKTA